MTAVAKGKWMGQELVDLRGIPYIEGDYVAKADISGRSANLRVSRVTRIDAENNKMYLDGSIVAIRFPQRMLIVTKEFT